MAHNKYQQCERCGKKRDMPPNRRAKFFTCQKCQDSIHRKCESHNKNITVRFGKWMAKNFSKFIPPIQRFQGSAAGVWNICVDRPYGGSDCITLYVDPDHPVFFRAFVRPNLHNTEADLRVHWSTRSCLPSDSSDFYGSFERERNNRQNEALQKIRERESALRMNQYLQRLNEEKKIAFLSQKQKNAKSAQSFFQTIAIAEHLQKAI
jgi:hypothetical protein